MDPYGYNSRGYSNSEMFQRNVYEADPNYGLMAHPEIPEAREPGDYDYMNGYPNRNQQVMHQFYHGDGQAHDNRHNYPYAPQRMPFEVNQVDELPSNRISVSIRLSHRPRNINNLISALHHRGLSCEVDGNEITVTGLPSSTRSRTRGLSPGEEEFLGIVRGITGDSRAQVV